MTDMERYKLELRTQERRTRVTEFDHLSSVIFQRDQLAQSLHGLLTALGVMSCKDTSPSGPELLEQAEEVVRTLQAVDSATERLGELFAEAPYVGDR